MMFSGFAVAYCLRVSLSEAIVAMVNQTAVSEDTATANTIDKFQCPRDPQLQRRNGELVWNRHEQGTVLAAFYYGYICTQVCSTKIRLYLGLAMFYRRSTFAALLILTFGLNWLLAVTSL